MALAAAQAQAQDTLQLRHQYTATIEQVFTAWSNPEILGQWFGPHSHNCKVEKYDFIVGGGYQIRMIPIVEDADCEGDTTQDSICAGQFVEIIPNKKIAMTFDWIENGAEMGETLLTIELQSVGDKTELTLTHERIPDEQVRNSHQGGWEGTLECLEEYLASI